MIWKDGSFVKGVAGVTTATSTASGITFEVPPALTTSLQLPPPIESASATESYQLIRLHNSPKCSSIGVSDSAPLKFPVLSLSVDVVCPSCKSPDSVYTAVDIVHAYIHSFIKQRQLTNDQMYQ